MRRLHLFAVCHSIVFCFPQEFVVLSPDEIRSAAAFIGPM